MGDLYYCIDCWDLSQSILFFQGFFNTKFGVLVCELSIALTLLFAFQEAVLILPSRCGLQFLLYYRASSVSD